MENTIFLGVKVKPGPIERYKLENFGLDNTVNLLRSEAEKRTNIPSSSLELMHHGKILKDESTLQDCGVKSGETVQVIKKKIPVTPNPPPTYSDSELQQLNASLRALGCTPNAPGWTKAMQLLNDETVMAEILEQAPSLRDDCVALSILHEVVLLAALGANLQTMRKGAAAHPELPIALRHLTNLVRSRTTAVSNDNVPTSGFAYSLEALSEDEDPEEEDNEEGDRIQITQEQLAAALQAATQSSPAVSRGRGGHESLLRLLHSGPRGSDPRPAAPSGSSNRPVITPEMFSEAISEAITRATGGTSNSGTPMEQSTTGSASDSPVASDADFTTQLTHMHEMGLLDDSINVRALLICSGDVNAAINLVFSGIIGEE